MIAYCRLSHQIRLLLRHLLHLLLLHPHLLPLPRLHLLVLHPQMLLPPQAVVVHLLVVVPQKVVVLLVSQAVVQGCR